MFPIDFIIYVLLVCSLKQRSPFTMSKNLKHEWTDSKVIDDVDYHEEEHYY